jgi:hypothetical protein
MADPGPHPALGGPLLRRVVAAWVVDPFAPRCAILGGPAEWENGFHFASTVPLCSSTVSKAAFPKEPRSATSAEPACRMTKIASGSWPLSRSIRAPSRNGWLLPLGLTSVTLSNQKHADTFNFAADLGGSTQTSSNVHDDAIGLPNSEHADLAALMVDAHQTITHDGYDGAALDHLAQSLSHASNFHLV